MKVAVAQVDSYDYVEVEHGLHELLGQIGGIASFVLPGKRVLIKPNMLGLPPDRAATTHPEVVLDTFLDT